MRQNGNKRFAQPTHPPLLSLLQDLIHNQICYFYPVCGHFLDTLVTGFPFSLVFSFSLFFSVENFNSLSWLLCFSFENGPWLQQPFCCAFMIRISRVIPSHLSDFLSCVNSSLISVFFCVSALIFFSQLNEPLLLLLPSLLLCSSLPAPDLPLLHSCSVYLWYSSLPGLSLASSSHSCVPDPPPSQWYRNNRMEMAVRYVSVKRGDR